MVPIKVVVGQSVVLYNSCFLDHFVFKDADAAVSRGAGRAVLNSVAKMNHIPIWAI